MAVWKQSEHVAVIGQNGSGKSYLVAHALLSARTGAVLVLRTKPDDIEYAGFRAISTIKRITPNHHKYVLDVSGKEPDEQALIILAGLVAIFGSACILAIAVSAIVIAGF